MTFAQLEQVEHPCGDALGSIAFSLTSDGGGYTYYWEDGGTGLVRRGLAPGIYTFIVRDPYGCEERCDVELQGALSCVLSYDVFYHDKYCDATIVLHVTDAVSGADLSNNPNLTVAWGDGDASGLIRQVSGLPGSVTCYDVTVSISSGEGMVSCCEQSLCAYVEFPQNCNGIEKCALIVNEVHRGEGGTYQFVELLVTGRGKGGCDTCDLRGYKLDDNNGYLIRGNDFLSGSNKEEIGIDEGYLEFSEDTAWSSVLGGSLIVLYGGVSSVLGESFPPDDVSDADGDGVYVMSVLEPGRFVGRQGVWDEGLKEMKYEGEALAADWSLVKLSAPADGMQVRAPGGEFMHGISSGQSAYAIEGAFDMWLSTQSMDGLNCRLTGLDPQLKLSYDCLSANTGVASPGQSNSVENDSLIGMLRSACGGNILPYAEDGEGAELPEGKGAGAGELVAVSEEVWLENEVRIWPNPYERELYVKMHSRHVGDAEVRVYAVSGVLLLSQEVSIEGKSEQQFRIASAGVLPRQMLFVEVRFPDGERRVLKVIHE